MFKRNKLIIKKSTNTNNKSIRKKLSGETKKINGKKKLIIKRRGTRVNVRSPPVQNIKSKMKTDGRKFAVSRNKITPPSVQNMQKKPTEKHCGAKKMHIWCMTTCFGFNIDTIKKGFINFRFEYEYKDSKLTKIKLVYENGDEPDVFVPIETNFIPPNLRSKKFVESKFVKGHYQYRYDDFTKKWVFELVLDQLFDKKVNGPKKESKSHANHFAIYKTRSHPKDKNGVPRTRIIHKIRLYTNEPITSLLAHTYPKTINHKKVRAANHILKMTYSTDKLDKVTNKIEYNFINPEEDDSEEDDSEEDDSEEDDSEEDDSEEDESEEDDEEDDEEDEYEDVVVFNVSNSN